MTSTAFGILIFLMLSAGCATHQDADLQVPRGPESSRVGEQPVKQKAPPFFLYRPGAGLTIEGREGRWRLRI